MYLHGSEEAGREQRQPWDYFKVLATIPGKEAFIDPAKSGCDAGDQ